MCGASVVFFHSTVSPTVTVSDAGRNENVVVPAMVTVFVSARATALASPSTVTAARAATAIDRERWTLGIESSV